MIEVVVRDIVAVLPFTRTWAHPTVKEPFISIEAYLFEAIKYVNEVSPSNYSP